MSAGEDMSSIVSVSCGEGVMLATASCRAGGREPIRPQQSARAAERGSAAAHSALRRAARLQHPSRSNEREHAGQASDSSSVPIQPRCKRCLISGRPVFRRGAVSVATMRTRCGRDVACRTAVVMERPARCRAYTSRGTSPGTCARSGWRVSAGARPTISQCASGSPKAHRSTIGSLAYAARVHATCRPLDQPGTRRQRERARDRRGPACERARSLRGDEPSVCPRCGSPDTVPAGTARER